jgi:hypothetical protein
MFLPTDFDALSQPQQLLVLANLERVDRGLAPVKGLTELARSRIAQRHRARAGAGFAEAADALCQPYRSVSVNGAKEAWVLATTITMRRRHAIPVSAPTQTIARRLAIDRASVVLD